MTRVVMAARETVFRAWTDPDWLVQWWGPAGMSSQDCEVDLRVGGEFRIVMVAGADSGERAGERAPVRATFQEVDVPARLVFTNQALDADGNVDLDGTTTVLFDDLGDGTTRVTVRASAEGLTAGAAQMLAGMQQGWDETVDKLADFVRAAASRQRPARP